VRGRRGGRYRDSLNNREAHHYNSKLTPESSNYFYKISRNIKDEERIDEVHFETIVAGQSRVASAWLKSHD
jgi:hypothetical protein